LNCNRDPQDGLYLAIQTAPSRLVLIVLLSGLCMANIDLAIVNVAVPSIHDTLGGSGAQLQLVVSAYVISYAMLLIVGARLCHMRGYGRMFLYEAGVFTHASLACGLAPDATLLIAARAVQGVGGAFSWWRRCCAASS
jgi:MFS family permease